MKAVTPKPAPGDQFDDDLFDQLDTIGQIGYLLALGGATICFCILCSHRPAYGYCWSCHCHNHVKIEPELDAEGRKMKATIAHLWELIKNLKEDAREDPPQASDLPHKA